MFRGTLYVLLTLVAWAVAPGRAGAEEPAPNAALHYWPGSYFLPRYSQLDEGEKKAFSDPVTSPLDDAARALVEKSGLALGYVRRGAQIDGCEWGVDPSDGPLMLIPHMDYVRPIQRVMLLRARLRLAEGRDTEAIEDLADSMVLARHLSADGTPVGHMVRCALEAQAIEVVAAQLGELDAEAVAMLEQRIGHLPPAESAARRIERERDMFVGWARAALTEGGPDVLRQRLGDLIRSGSGGVNDGRTGKLLEDLDAAIAEGTDHLTNLLDRTQEDYGSFVALMNAPADSLPAADAALAEILAEGNVFTRSLIGSAINPPVLRTVELKAEARLAMLKAALAIARGGPDEAEAVRDPFGAGPLRYSKTGDGFVLTSSLTLDGQPFAMTFIAPQRR